MQADGKVVVAGFSRSCPSSDFAVARFKTDGNPDMSFGVGSKVTTDFSGRWDDGAGLARQPDGKLIIVGMSRTTYSLADFAVVRLCENGSLDDGVHCGGPAFGAGGKTTTDFFGDWETLSALLLLPQGKIVVGGTATCAVTGGTWDEDFALALYNPNGSLDVGFAGDGRETIDFGATDEGGCAMALQADGKILISGDSVGHLAMARFMQRTYTNLPLVLR